MPQAEKNIQKVFLAISQKIGKITECNIRPYLAPRINNCLLVDVVVDICGIEIAMRFISDSKKPMIVNKGRAIDLDSIDFVETLKSDDWLKYNLAMGL